MALSIPPWLRSSSPSQGHHHQMDPWIHDVVHRMSGHDITQELRHEMGPRTHDVVSSSTGCLHVLYVAYAKGQPRSPPWPCTITETSM